MSFSVFKLESSFLSACTTWVFIQSIPRQLDFPKRLSDVSPKNAFLIWYLSPECVCWRLVIIFIFNLNPLWIHISVRYNVLRSNHIPCKDLIHQLSRDLMLNVCKLSLSRDLLTYGNRQEDNIELLLHSGAKI